ncbi:signal peptidase II [Paeniglutamicibacter kerguelensis]|uniref:Lipoprotein signal peptidase n=1 Tax=Paeniglutamicibacter kerguelensis TaxID=254788 RepID=A0ABS4XHL9_9MICC|nr:signal peptidase II [Paeniglutamicibacter kerguelensis]MBP2387947.1 signal peptidase II [Paeniglutamicibacter kerguelensis]
MSGQTTDHIAAPGRPARTARTVMILCAAGLVAIDLAVKALAEALLSTGETIDLGLMNLRLLYNPGVAFSFGANLPGWVVIAVTGLIITAMAWYSLTTAPAMGRLSRTGATLLLGGAVGNFIDRLDGRGVVDYLHSGWFATFNLADVFVTTGVVLYALGTLRSAPPQHGK